MKIGLVAAFILLATIIPNAVASDDYEEKIKELLKDGKYDKDTILNKLKGLYWYKLVCDKDEPLPQESEVTCEAVVGLDEDKIDKIIDKIYDEYDLRIPKEKAEKIVKDILIDLVNDIHIRVHDPDNNIVLEEDIESPKWLDNKVNDDNNTKYVKSKKFSFTADKHGEWTVKVKYTVFGEKIKKFKTTFFVLPESTIGPIAVIGSSVAVLAVFISRQRKNNPII